MVRDGAEDEDGDGDEDVAAEGGRENQGRRRPAIFKYGFRFHCCISSAFMKLMSSHN